MRAPPLCVPMDRVWLMVRIMSFRVSLIWTLGSNPDLGCLVLLYDPYIQSIALVLVIGYGSKVHERDIYFYLY